MISIFSHTRETYAKKVHETLGKGAQHAAILYREWMHTGVVSRSHPAFHNAPQLYDAIIQSTDFHLPSVSKQLIEGDTHKLLLKFSDGKQIESVVIPMRFGSTLCVSSQVGCRMGCTFCQTGRMGLLRNLTVEEIVSQAFVAKHILHHPIRNIVFMGMGEPMDNYEAVVQAIQILSDQGGLGFARRHLTVSTVGRVDGIQKFMRDVDPAVNLAVSINAPNDELRRKIMPLTRKYSLSCIKEALLEYCSHPRRTVLLGYVLMKGINDSLELADQLVEFTQGLRVKVNLIPYNPQDTDPYKPSSNEQIQAFASRLRSRDVYTLLRQTKGDEIMAACGQLGVVSI